MKHIKHFLKFEAVIVPEEIDSGAIIRDLDDLKDYGDSNDFDVVEYDEFLQSIPAEDKTTAPPKFGNPFFALYHPIRKKPMFVLCDPMVLRMMPNFKEIVDDIISHERVHAEQNNRRSGLTFRLPNPKEKKKYFSDKDEIMAFSWTIAQGLHKDNDSFDDAMESLNKETVQMPPMGRGGMPPMPGRGTMPPMGDRGMPPMPGRGTMPPMGDRGMPPMPGRGTMPKVYLMMWNDIKSNCDEPVINKYKKNIYNYLKGLYTI